MLWLARVTGYARHNMCMLLLQPQRQQTKTNKDAGAFVFHLLYVDDITLNASRTSSETATAVGDLI